MRIAHVITRSTRGGAQVHLADLIAGLPGQIEPHVIVGDEGFLTQRLRTLGVPFSVCPALQRNVSPFADLRAITEVERQLRLLKPQIAHMHSTKAGFVGRIAAWRAGVPSVFTAHGWPFSPGYRLSRRVIGIQLERTLGRLTQHIINVSEYDRMLAIKHRIVSQERTSVIYNGIPTVAPRARPGAEPVSVIMVARLAYPKDHELLLRAVARLERAPDVRIVGDGPDLERIRQVAHASKLSSAVQFLGDRDDVPELLAQSSLFVLPSRAEGLPISVIEAMRAGLPVLATDVGGLPELVADGVNGFLVPPNDIEGFSHKLAVLLSNARLRSEMGAASRARFVAGFSLESLVSRTLDVYELVLSGRALPNPTLGIAT